LDGPLPKLCPAVVLSHQKVLKFYKFDEKRAIIPRWVMGFTSKL
jgi:hypothetical protein